MYLTTLTTKPAPAANARDRILGAAFECFCELAYEKSSMKRIAARLPVSGSVRRPSCFTRASSTTSAATFMAKFAAAANHNDFLKQAYLDYQPTQRRNLFYLVRELIPEARIEVSVELIETVLLEMALRARSPPT